MATQVVMGAMTMCTFGMAPSVATFMPTNKTLATTPAGNITDSKPLLNVMPFGMCVSLANPVVAAATAAALGVLTPMPCIPATVVPWLPGTPTVFVGAMPATDLKCKAMCMWGGVVSVVVPGQFIATEVG